MEIKVGTSDIRDIKIGSTSINTVWVGATKVWQRVSVLVGGSGYAYAEGSTATASRSFELDPYPGGNVTWSYVVNSGPTNGGVLSSTSQTATTFIVFLSNSSGFDSASATITVTGTTDTGFSASAVTSLTAVRDTR